MKKGFTLLIMFALLFAATALPAAPVEASKAVIVTINRSGLPQALANQNMSIWLERGSLALMNISTASRSTSDHLFVTLGAGSRAMGQDSARLTFSREEEYAGAMAQDLFMLHQGIMPNGQVLQLGMAEITRLNMALQHPVRPGLLGETLRQAGKKTAVIGNADTSGIFRETALMLADSSGEIDFGDVSRNVLQEDDLFPFGKRLDKEKIWDLFQNIYREADVVLIDWGDFNRLNDYRRYLQDTQALQLENEIFADLDWLLTNIFANLDNDDLLILLFPVTLNDQTGGGQFGFIAALGDDFPPGHLLSSATTRRDGLIAVTDVAPLILDHLGLGVPVEMLGRTVTSIGPGNAEDLLQMQAEIFRTFQLRPPLMRAYVLMQIIIVLGAILNLFIRLLPPHRFEAPLLGLLSFPLVLLYLPLYRALHTLGYILPFVITILLVLVMQRLLPHVLMRFAVVGLATSLSLVVDLWRNAPLIKVSVLGYDPISGARYYGLGNEFMGVLVGATVLGTVAALSFASKKRFPLYFGMLVLYFVLVVLLMVAPWGGANFGGTVTATVAFIVTIPVLGQIRLNWRKGLLLAFALCILAISAVYLNVNTSQDTQSHLGRTVFLMQEDGLEALRDIVARKAAMNIRLFRYSQWSRAFLLFLGVLTLLFFRPRGILREIHRQYPKLSAGFLGIIAGSITAFIVNDSGVVAAATTLLFAGVPLIIMVGKTMSDATPNLWKR